MVRPPSSTWRGSDHKTNAETTVGRDDAASVNSLNVLYMWISSREKRVVFTRGASHCHLTRERTLLLNSMLVFWCHSWAHCLIRNNFLSLRDPSQNALKTLLERLCILNTPVVNTLNTANSLKMQPIMQLTLIHPTYRTNHGKKNKLNFCIPL